jgi:hypothetical protein
VKKFFTPLVALTVGCTVAATVFGFGSDVFSFRSAYAGAEREVLIQFARSIAFLILAAVLVFRGGWRGVGAAIVMTVCATFIEWSLFPFAFEFASIEDPSGYDKEYGESIARPTYGAFALFDILGIGIAAAVTQGLRLMAHVDPNRTPDE